MGFYLDSVLTAEKRLNHPNNLLNSTEFRTVGNGKHDYRGDGNRKPYKKLSSETKGLVSALAQVSGVKETSKSFGIHPTTVSSLKRGMTLDGNHADPEVRKQAESVLDSIGRKSASVVSEALERLLNPARIDEAKTSELALIAGTAMNILEKSQPKNNTFIAGKVIFMVPPSREVGEYDVIDVVPVRD